MVFRALLHVLLTRVHELPTVTIFFGFLCSVRQFLIIFQEVLVIVMLYFIILIKVKFSSWLFELDFLSL